MFCKNCGYENKDESSFCVNCGSSLKPAEAPQPEQQPEQQPTIQQQAPVQQTPATPTPGYGQYNQYNSPAQTPIAGAIKALAVSPAFLTAIIAYTFTQVLSVIQNVFGYNSIIGGRTIASLATSVGAVIGAIPSILLIVGLWLIYSSARDKFGRGMRTSGLTMVQVMLIIFSVFIGILSVYVALGALFIGAVGSQLNDIVGWIYIPIPDWFGGIVAIVLIIVFVFVVLLLIMYIKSAIMASEAKKAVAFGLLPKTPSMFVAVIVFISAALSIISSFGSLVSGGILYGGTYILTFLQGIASAVASFSFGIVVIRYRNIVQGLSRAMTQPGIAPNQQNAQYIPQNNQFNNGDFR